MGALASSGLTFEDLLRWYGEDGVKRELIGGQVHVSPDARLRHQRVITQLTVALAAYIREHGGDVFPGANVDLAVGDHVEPDVVVLGPDFDGQTDELSVRSPPTLLVEVSSPSTRRYDLRQKRPLYERHRVPEFWFVDLNHDRVEVSRLGGSGYGDAEAYGRGERFASTSLPGLVVAVDDVLGRETRAGRRRSRA